mgnify:CR=1 FL=1
MKKKEVSVLVKEHEKESFRKIGFDHSREKKGKDLEWGDCTSFFIGNKSEFISCIAQKKDFEFMVKLGFVVSTERLKEPSTDVNSSNNRK